MLALVFHVKVNKGKLPFHRLCKKVKTILCTRVCTERLQKTQKLVFVVFLSTRPWQNCCFSECKREFVLKAKFYATKFIPRIDKNIKV